MNGWIFPLVAIAQSFKILPQKKPKNFLILLPQPPSLQIIIDLPLNHQANFVLAGTYYKIAQEYPDLIQPPNIEISARRT